MLLDAKSSVISGLFKADLDDLAEQALWSSFRIKLQHEGELMRVYFIYSV